MNNDNMMDWSEQSDSTMSLVSRMSNATPGNALIQPCIK
jgi:hypothetical protein